MVVLCPEDGIPSADDQFISHVAGEADPFPEQAEGGQHAEFKIPGRKGYLFDPDRYPFLEGREVVSGQGLVISEDSEIPLTTNHWPLTTDHCLISFN